MTQNLQNTIIKNFLKHNNQFRSVINESLIWIKIITYIGKKIKVETTVKERDQKLLDFIKMDAVRV